MILGSSATLSEGIRDVECQANEALESENARLSEALAAAAGIGEADVIQSVLSANSRLKTEKQKVLCPICFVVIEDADM